MDFAEQNQVAPDQVLGHWYYRAKFALLRRSVGRLLRPDAQLADLGCGLGVFLTLMEQSQLLPPNQMVGIDPAARPRQVSLGGTVRIETNWPDRAFDLVLLMDVLEHIQDDTGALAEVWTKLKPGGHAFITVPAFQFLWSRHDVVLGHERRYTRSSLKRLLRHIPGLEIEQLHYFYGLILPVAMVVRLLRRHARDSSSDMKPAPGWLNGLLLRCLTLEAGLAPANKLAGLTVVALVRKAG